MKKVLLFFVFNLIAIVVCSQITNEKRLYQRAEEIRLENRYAKALEIYKRIVEQGDEYKNVSFFGKAHCENELKLFDSSLTSINSFLAPIGDRHYEGRKLRALNLLHLDKLQLAEVIYSQLVNEKPMDYSLYINRGLVYRKLKKNKLAINDFKRSVEIKPDSFNALHNLADLQAELNKLEKAEINFKILIERHPNSAKAFGSLGSFYLREKDNPNKAIPYFEEGLQLKGDISESLKIDLAYAYYFTDNYIYSRKYFNQFQMMRYKDFLMRGNCNFELGKNKKGLNDYLSALEIDSTQSSVFNNLAFFYYDKKEKYNESIIVLKKAIKIDSLNEDVNSEAVSRNNLSYSYYMNNELEKAKEQVDKSIQMFDSNSYAYKNKALIYSKLGLVEEACNALQEAIKFEYDKVSPKEVDELKKSLCR
jgi:tetratricopeptide (TPR) repeat protein